MTIFGERTEQLDIFCHVTGFTSDFLSFVDVELIRSFHGALQLIRFLSLVRCNPCLWPKLKHDCCTSWATVATTTTTFRFRLTGRFSPSLGSGSPRSSKEPLGFFNDLWRPDALPAILRLIVNKDACIYTHTQTNNNVSWM